MTHLDQRQRGGQRGNFPCLLTSELIRENGRAKEDGEKKVKVSKQKRKREFVCVWRGERVE